MNINITGEQDKGGEIDKREVALVMEKYTELLSGGELAGR
jgi:hypothetical protein